MVLAGSDPEAVVVNTGFGIRINNLKLTSSQPINAIPLAMIGCGMANHRNDSRFLPCRHLRDGAAPEVNNDRIFGPSPTMQIMQRGD